MGKAKLLKKYALVDPVTILRKNGWQSVPSTHTAFTMWRKSKASSTLFLYETGEWHVVDRFRTVLNSGPDTETLIAWLAGDVKPLEHMGSNTSNST